MNSRCPPLLRDLLLLPSPTGSEQVAQRFIHDQFQDIADHIVPDVAGNLILVVNPGAKRKLVLAAHCDQIGFLVKYISADGYVYVDPLGSTDPGVIPGGHVLVHNRRGPVPGIFGRKPLSFQGVGQATQVPDMSKMWIDIGARSREEAVSAVEVGDYATFPGQITELQNSRLSAPALDNKAGLYVCLETLRRCARQRPAFGLYVVSSVQEEIGSRGVQIAAQRLMPDIGIAVDAVPATDDPGFDLPVASHPECRLGGGPMVSVGPTTTPAVAQMLVEAAKTNSLACHLNPCAKAAPNDSRMLQTVACGAAVASLGLPLRNMHTQVEIVSLEDLESAITLLSSFICSLKESVDLRPFAFAQS